MRRVLLVTWLLTLMISACAPAAATEAPSVSTERPESTPTLEVPTPQPVPIGPAEETVVKQLAANLGLQESDISVLSSEKVEFGDACLDVVMPDVMCAQVITPGSVIVLEAEGVQYEYHASEDGSRVQPSTFAITWKREGGIAGFCDTLTVFLSGEVYASQCMGKAKGKMGTFADLLSPQEQAKFNNWIQEFAETHLDASDPKGVADRMEVTLELFGMGSEPPGQAEQQALFKFAQDLYQELTR